MVNKGNDTFQVSVMNFNVQQLTTMLGPKVWWDQANRAQRIPAAIRAFCKENNKSLDVLVLNEAFNSYATAICEELRDLFPYQTPLLGQSTRGWKSTSGGFKYSYLVISGGVIILSKHEIVEQRQHIYTEAHNNTWDCRANKGIAYAKIQVQPNEYIHVLGSHLQADEGHVPFEEAHQVRMAQLREMRQFLVDELKLPKTERVIVCGDLNVEYTTETFRQDLETNLQTKIWYDHKTPGSFSAVDNWMTKANARYNRESETRNELLDYVLVPSDYAQPVNDLQSKQIQVIPLKAAEKWYWTYLAKEWPDDGGMTSDLSDHYPVMSTYEYKKGN